MANLQHGFDIVWPTSRTVWSKFFRESLIRFIEKTAEGYIQDVGESVMVWLKGRLGWAMKCSSRSNFLAVRGEAVAHEYLGSALGRWPESGWATGFDTDS
jgi:hypothetical protein